MGLLDQAVARLKETDDPDRPPRSPGATPSDQEASPIETTAEDRIRDAGVSQLEPVIEADAARGGRISLDAARLRAAGFLVPGHDADRALRDEYRRIKRGLIANVEADDLHPDQADLPRNLIMITSAVAAEGKTFTAANLALSLSQEFDRRVLLVDADVIQKGASRLFGVQDYHGLVDYLSADSGLFEDYLVDVEGVERLQLLPAGGSHPHMEELLASERMADWLAGLAEQSPDLIVIFDASPLLLTSEAGALSAQMGQIGMVVRADVTPKHTVEQALGEIPPERFAGLILNSASRKLGARFSGDYYYG